MLPDFLMTPDPSFAAFSAAEATALWLLRLQWEGRGQRDRLWAMVPVLRDDGAAQLVVLTVPRVEAYAPLYRTRQYSIEASTDPS